MNSRDETQGVAELIRRAEARLERALAAGWRNAEGDLERLSSDADRLERSGLAELALCVRQVSAATPAERLDRLAVALAACRLARAQLADSRVPPGSWEPLVGKARGAARIALLGRLAVDQGEAWVAVRVSGYASELLLVEPFPLASSPWFGRPIQGRPRWQARFPLGASRDIQLVVLTGAREARDDHLNSDVLADFRQQAATNVLSDGQSVLPGHGKLQVKRLSPDDAPSYAWIHPTNAAAFAATASDQDWTLCWVDGQVITPLVLIRPPSLLRAARLIHLTEGNPDEEFPG